jgi:2-methylfumaryl-CoA hydratase
MTGRTRSNGGVNLRSVPSAPKPVQATFEDFRLRSNRSASATPRTVSVGDVALYQGLFGGRFAVQSSDVFAQTSAFRKLPSTICWYFIIVFGKTVPDISLNAVANLATPIAGFSPVYPGSTLNAVSEIIGLERELQQKDRHCSRPFARFRRYR